MQTTQEQHETEKQQPLIRMGPGAQYRANRIGGKIVEIVGKQLQAMTLSMKLYEAYVDECKQRGLRPRRLM